MLDFYEIVLAFYKKVEKILLPYILPSQIKMLFQPSKYWVIIGVLNNQMLARTMVEIRKIGQKHLGHQGMWQWNLAQVWEIVVIYLCGYYSGYFIMASHAYRVIVDNPQGQGVRTFVQEV